MEIAQDRFKILQDLIQVKGMSIRYADFTTSEIQYIIDETPLSEEQRKMCIMQYIKRIKQKDMENYFSYSKSGMNYQKRICSIKLRQTACKLFCKKD